MVTDTDERERNAGNKSVAAAVLLASSYWGGAFSWLLH